MSFKQFVCFTGDAGGLEKILRLLQSLAQILAAYALIVEDAVLWIHLRRQFALGRRYFRFFRFIACFSKAYESFFTPINLLGILEIGKWSFMGAYLLLESVTILDAMGAWPAPWAEACMLEANRFWFYSLVASILKGGIGIWGRAPEDSRGGGEQGRKEAAPQEEKSMNGVRRGFIVDCFDLLIPGHVTGWIPSSLALVGLSSAVSTLLSSKDIWDRFH